LYNKINEKKKEGAGGKEEKKKGTYKEGGNVRNSSNDGGFERSVFLSKLTSHRIPDITSTCP
jgi:hypothetical protein